MRLLLIIGLNIFCFLCLAQAQGPLEKMPIMGFGTWVDAHSSHPSIIQNPVKMALETGYRHIDAATNYGNQKEIGAAIGSFLQEQEGKVTREDLWITSKYPGMPVNYQTLEESVDKTLRELGVEYLDLLLIHHPAVPQEMTFSAAIGASWENMNQLLQTGKVRHIGVSNFYQNHLNILMGQMEEKGKAKGWVKPLVNQIEINPMAQEEDLAEFCQKEGIQVTAYAPIGGLGSIHILQNEAILEVAKKHSASPAQVILAGTIKRGIQVIPKSTKRERIEENFFSLSLVDKLDKEDMEKIKNSYGSLNFPTTNTAQTFSWESQNLK